MVVPSSHNPTGRVVITDEIWARPELAVIGNYGRPGGDSRLFIESLLCYIRRGHSWPDAPPWFGRWYTLYQRAYCWAMNGMLQRVAKLLVKEKHIEPRNRSRAKTRQSSMNHICWALPVPVFAAVRIACGNIVLTRAVCT